MKFVLIPEDGFLAFCVGQQLFTKCLAIHTCGCTVLGSNAAFLPVSYSSFKLVGYFHCLKLLFVTLCKTTWLELKLHTYSGCVLFLSSRRTIHCHIEYFPQWSFHSHFPVRMVWKWSLWCDWMGEWKGQECVSVCAHMCVCMCVCVCVCVYVYVLACICVWVCVYIIV